MMGGSQPTKIYLRVIPTMAVGRGAEIMDVN